MSKALQAKEILHRYILQMRVEKQFRLAPERVLADQLGYSRATIEKALGVLEGEGLIVRKKGSGTFIAGHDRKHSMTIALVMRNAYHYTDAHFRLIVEETSRYAEKTNIYVQIFDRLTDMFAENPEKNSLLEAVRRKLIDGVIITSRMPLSIISRISSICPTVSINNIFGDGGEVPCISCDYFRAGFLAGKYLLKKGHRKVAYVTEDLSHPESAFDFSGFRAAFEMDNIAPTERDILETGQNLHTFNERVMHFFRNADYTACFVRSTHYAAKMGSVLRRNGIIVPDDLSIIAAGNYRNGMSDKVKLTVIDNQLSTMCCSALELLQKAVESNKSLKGGLTLLSPTIIEHNSVLPLRNNEKGPCSTKEGQ